MKKVWGLALAAAMIMGLATGQANALTLPEDDSEAKYFYVFGPQGEGQYGAEDGEMTLYVDVPATTRKGVKLSVYDPDTGGKRDFRSSSRNEWDTTTQFQVYGNGQLLDEKVFDDTRYNQRFYTFGPFDPSAGRKVGNNYRFILRAKTLTGDDGNLFKVKVDPSNSSVFSYDITFRLASDKGEKMHFYPDVPADTTELIVENFDLDREGGRSILVDPQTNGTYEIADSRSGEWEATTVPLTGTRQQHFDYVITKEDQKYANAGLRFRNQNGKLLPIYFSKFARSPMVRQFAEEPDLLVASPIVEKVEELVEEVKQEKMMPVVDQIVEATPVAAEETYVPAPTGSKACNVFTFDARGSYDQEQQNLEYVWEFGDGNSSTEAVITHEYSKPGLYDVRLSVTDNSGLQCDTATTTQTVYVNEAPKAAFDAVDKVCTEQSVEFDAGETTDNKLENVSYAWDFGDGTQARTKTAEKIFSRGGLYTVTLYVDDNDNTQCSQDSIQKTILVNTPPQADAGDDVALCLLTQEDPYTVTFDASSSMDPDADDLVYEWDFGDGETGEGLRTTHVYKKGGEYIARLTIKDVSGTECSVDTDTVLVKLNRAPVADAGENKRVCLGRDVRFNGADSFAEEGETLSYMWDFGDGNEGSGVSPEHKYEKGGTYEVRLKVDNGQETICSTATDTVQVEVNSQPIVEISSVEPSCVGNELYFNASSSYDPDGDDLIYTWDFGDGTTMQAGPNVSHVFTKGGDYKVVVSVDDSRGYSCSKASASTLVKVNTKPVANAGNNLACCVDKSTDFDGTGSYDDDGDSLTYAWTFGDGGTSSKSEVSHVYNTSGVYEVFLTVDDGSGTACSSDTAGFIAEVNAKPVPVIQIQ